MSVNPVNVEVLEIRQRLMSMRNEAQILQKRLTGLIKTLPREKVVRDPNNREIPLWKKCRAHCKQKRLADFFYKDSRYKDGLYPYCKFCKEDMRLARTARRAVEGN